MKVKSRQYSGRSDSSAIASRLPLNRDHVGDFLPAHTSDVSWRSDEIEKGDLRPRGAIRS